ncbi:class I SAM-dependent methyltransferase [Odoribacter sp. OF09-27XD]|jgi:hypothetical protein|nr:class I SAM-dependent methyltransferase [Odoribacter sp. OF09-27XD]RHV96955.1 class I SAM-dependent methyltransferase [Odoribacter sp. OF09-27XD]
MSKWADYYKDRVNNKKYEDAFRRKYDLFLGYIAKRIDSSINRKTGFRKINIKEEGCGIGTVSKLVGSFFAPYLFIFSDIDPEMIKLCDINNSLHSPDFVRNEIKSNFLVEDILSSDKTYVPNSFVVTHGVLEHFSTEDVKSIIDGYNSNDLVTGHIHYVPTDKYTTPSFGDERLCSVDEWVDLVNPTRYIIDNCGKDLYLITEK